MWNRVLRGVKLNEYRKCFYAGHQRGKKETNVRNLFPATDLSSVSEREKKLAAKRVWSRMGFGEVGLWEGGVGSVADGAGVEILASSAVALGPSKCTCARVKHADAMMRGGNNMQSGVLYLQANRMSITSRFDPTLGFGALLTNRGRCSTHNLAEGGEPSPREDQ
jgi:hypothetical protein